MQSKEIARGRCCGVRLSVCAWMVVYNFIYYPAGPVAVVLYFIVVEFIYLDYRLN